MVSPIDLTQNYLNFVDILQFEVIGGDLLMIMLFALILAFLIAKYAVPYHTGIGIMLIYFVVISIVTYNWSVYVLAEFLVSVVSFIFLSRIFR